MNHDLQKNPSGPDTKTAGEKGGFSVDFFGLLFLCITVMLLLSLISFDRRDPSINHAVRGYKYYHNWMGMAGAYVSGLLTDLFGFASYAAALFMGALSVSFLGKLRPWPWWRWMSIPLLGCCLAVAGRAWGIGLGQVRSGGLLGHTLLDFSVRCLSLTGSAVLWFFLFLLAAQSMGGFTWAGAALNLAGRIKAMLDEAGCEERRQKAAVVSAASPPPGPPPPRAPFIQFEPASCPVKERTPSISISTSIEALPPRKPRPTLLARLLGRAPVPAGRGGEGEGAASLRAKAPAAEFMPNMPEEAAGAAAPAGAVPDRREKPVPARSRPAPPRPEAKPPPLDMLRPAEGKNRSFSPDELQAKGLALMTCLNDFSVQAELVRITPGPVVTTFEVRPAPGVKAARIVGLNDDLALGLKATSVRIQAPIPGTDTVGIEIPNGRRETVNLRELIASPVFQQSAGPLTLVMGKDRVGAPVMADLAAMPHLLVGGATGTGKSVFLNAVLLSILYKARPEEVKLLLIDPKRVELKVYADLPHLVHPIVVDMALARNALAWAVEEMELRYESLARLNVRNISAYNKKMADLHGNMPPDLADLRPMPYLVLLIDEFADLMATTGKEVEISVVRLAQLARAAGIHLIIATQRPDAEVFTGLIKANFPCRVSFQVISTGNSRIILDVGGAERLLGKGDMLYKPGGGALQRLHGAYVDQNEVEQVADYWRGQQKPDYQVDFSSLDQEETNAREDQAASGDDPLYPEVIKFVLERENISIGLLQRRFTIGFNRAARIVEQLEKDGLVGQAQGSKPRNVIR